MVSVGLSHKFDFLSTYFLQSAKFCKTITATPFKMGVSTFFRNIDKPICSYSSEPSFVKRPQERRKTPQASITTTVHWAFHLLLKRLEKVNKK